MVENEGEIITPPNNKFISKSLDILNTLDVYDSVIWATFIILYIFIILMLAIMNVLKRWNCNEYQRSKFQYLIKNLWIVIRVFCGQIYETTNGHESQIGFQYRIIWFILIFMYFYMITFYNAMFSTDLVTHSKPQNIESLQDLVESNLKPVWLNGNPLTYDFRAGVLPIYARVWEKAKKMGIESSLYDLDLKNLKFLESKRNNSAFIAQSLFINFLRHYYCETRHSSGYVAKMKFSKKRCYSLQEERSARNQISVG